MIGYKKSTLVRQSLSEVKIVKTLDVPSSPLHNIMKRFITSGDISAQG